MCVCAEGTLQTQGMGADGGSNEAGLRRAAVEQRSAGPHLGKKWSQEVSGR